MDTYQAELKALEVRVEALRGAEKRYRAVLQASEGLSRYAPSSDMLVGFTDMGGRLPAVDLSAHLLLASYADIGTFGKRLRKHGYRLISQTDQGPLRVVHYTGRIILFATFGSQSVCQYVQTGVKAKPVYALKCV